MKTFFYKPDNAWVGDLIPYYENGTYYGFYLHDPRGQENIYAEETTWHLVSTTDFINIKYHGQAIERGADNERNKNAYTGSVIKDKNGVYHAFYTAFNADVKQDGKSLQAIMKATGTDLFNLKNDKDFLLTADAEIYEEFDWRDPFVYYNEDENCYHMLVTAREKNSGALRGGCIALCKSQDLVNWQYCAPFYSPKQFVTMECPDLFKMGDYWYLVFSTFSDKFTTHYRISKSASGPFIIPDDDVFDTRANYAIKTAGDKEKRYAFGWIASKYKNNDFNEYEWGGTMAFHEIVQNKNDGTLYVKSTNAENHYFDKPYSNSIVKDEIFLSEKLSSKLWQLPQESFCIDLTFSVKKAKEFGIALHTDSELEKGYFLRINTLHNEVAWDCWPRCTPGFYQWQIKGDVPFAIETRRFLKPQDEYNIRLIKENDICIVYINNQIALSSRMYNHNGGMGGLYLLQGEMIIKNIKINTKQKGE